jgi:hypothetical protein
MYRRVVLTLLQVIAVCIGALSVQAELHYFTPIYGTLGAYLPTPTVWAWTCASYEGHWVIAFTVVIIPLILPSRFSADARDSFRQVGTCLALIAYTAWPLCFLLPLFDLGNHVC